MTIQPADIAAVLDLTGVTLTVENGRATITANEPVTPEMQARVQAWHDAGEVNPVPRSVRTAQLIQWLIDRDLLTTVEAKLNNPTDWPDEKTRLKAKVRFEREPNTNRDDPLVDSLGHQLGMDDAAIDAAFVQISQYQ